MYREYIVSSYDRGALFAYLSPVAAVSVTCLKSK
jgi:hypothetical protein